MYSGKEAESPKYGILNIGERTTRNAILTTNTTETTFKEVMMTFNKVKLTIIMEKMPAINVTWSALMIKMTFNKGELSEMREKMTIKNGKAPIGRGKNNMDLNEYGHA